MSNPKVWNPNLTFNAVPGSLALDTLDLYVSQSINGVTGGAEAPVSPIIIGGAGLQVTGAFEASDVSAITLGAAGAISVPVGSQIIVLGTQVINSGAIVQWQSGALLDVAAGATMTVGGAATFAGTTTISGALTASGAVSLTGTVTLGVSTPINIASARTYTRCTRMYETPSSTVWGRATGLGNSFPLIVQQTAVITPGDLTQEVVYEVVVPDGATITAISMRVQGAAGHAALPGVLPQFEFWKVNLASGTQTLIDTRADGSGSVGIYETLHPVTMSPLAEVADTADYKYLVRFQGEAGANFVVGMVGIAPRVTCTRAKIGEE